VSQETVENKKAEIVQNQIEVKTDSIPIPTEKITEVSKPNAEPVIPREEKEKSNPVTFSKFLIVAGSFQHLENANKLIDEYKSKGFKPELTGLSTKGYYTVIIASYQNLNEALNALQSIKATINPEAWILPL
jgi:cell division protein FtsN